MQEAGASYRAIGLLVPAVWLRHATIARAAEYVGADWSHVAGAAPGTHAPGTNPPMSGASGSPAGLSPNSPPGSPGSTEQNAVAQVAAGQPGSDAGAGRDRAHDHECRDLHPQTSPPDRRGGHRQTCDAGLG